MSEHVETTGLGLLERLEQGPVICAEGYLFECERRGYLQAGAFVPEVVLEHPEVVRQLHREFVHAGSDVVEAFTYYAHREKLRVIGREAQLEEPCERLEAAGADVVGLNCSRGPETMLPMLGPIREAVSCHVAALPVPYRTTPEEPTFQALRDPALDGRPFPTALDPFTCNRYELADFGKAALELGCNYLGVCCGAGPHHIRSLAEGIGRTT